MCEPEVRALVTYWQGTASRLHNAGSIQASGTGPYGWSLTSPSTTSTPYTALPPPITCHAPKSDGDTHGTTLTN